MTNFYNMHFSSMNLFVTTWAGSRWPTVLFECKVLTDSFSSLLLLLLCSIISQSFYTTPSSQSSYTIWHGWKKTWTLAHFKSLQVIMFLNGFFEWLWRRLQKWNTGPPLRLVSDVVLSLFSFSFPHSNFNAIWTY